MKAGLIDRRLRRCEHSSGASLRMGLDLSADGRGVLVIVYAEIDESGLGKNGVRYRVAKSAAGVDLIPE